MFVSGNQRLQATYDRPAPAPFFRCQADVGYRIPEAGVAVLRVLAAEREPELTTALDVGCSYGITGALLRRGLTLEALYAHFRADSWSAADDRRFFDQHDPDHRLRLYGLDVAANAVTYASSVGLLRRGFVGNLEEQEPSGDLRAALPRIDVLYGTGIFSYITPRTFDRLLSARRTPPRVVAFPLRLTDFEPFRRVFAAHGLRTERMNTEPLVQQRLGTAREYALVAERPEGFGRCGGSTYYLADCYVSSPVESPVEPTPLCEALRPATASSVPGPA